MRSQPFARVPASVNEHKFSFRLRHVLLLALIASLGAWIVPRARATFELHNRAVAFADYAQCMVGPTGVELVQRDSAGFLRLVRRRVLAAMPEDLPLVSCFSLAEQLQVDHATLKLHQTRALDFIEYENGPQRRARRSLQAFRLPTDSINELTERAWPFVRQGYLPLMQASSHAKEAIFPSAPPAYALGSGLPSERAVYRSAVAFGDTWLLALGSGAHRSVLLSKNGGLDWARGGTRLALDLLDRCVVDDEGRAFTLSRLGTGERIVVSQGPDAPPQVAVLGSSQAKVAGISCDSSALVAALVGEDQAGLRQVSLRHCPFRRACQDISPPALGGDSLFYPADVARVGGDIVLAKAVGGITRIASSRDDGQSWTPWTVVYDALEGHERSAAPFKLLVVGDTVLLYGTAPEQERYAVLFSTDHGASFHAPALAPSTAPNQNTRANQKLAEAR